MNNLLNIKIVSAKLLLILHLKNELHNISSIIYKLSLVDFLDSDLNNNNESLKNLNSISFYNKYLWESIKLLEKYNYIIIDGTKVKLTYSGYTISSELSKEIISDIIVKKISWVSNIDESDIKKYMMRELANLQIIK